MRLLPCFLLVVACQATSPVDDTDWEGWGDPVEEPVDPCEDCTPCDEAGFTDAIGDDDATTFSIIASRIPTFSCTYDVARDVMFLVMDNDNGFVEGVYTGVSVRVDDHLPDPAVMNTEHTWPRGRGADEEPALCDLHHLFPSDSDANNVRGSYDFGEVSGAPTWESGGSAFGRDAAGELVFEPRPQHRGNVARAMLYFALAYDHLMPAAEADLYRRWHAADPPDATEINRSLFIGERQGAANPFVTCDELVDAALPFIDG